jgi:plastocyanin
MAYILNTKKLLLKLSGIIFLQFILVPSLFSKVYTVQFQAYSYSPNALGVLVGDTIKWIGDFSTFSLQSVSVPSDAAPFGPINSGDTFLYVVKFVGEYDYQNNTNVSLGMKGYFVASEPLNGITNEGKEFYLGMLTPSYNSVATAPVLKDFAVYALISTHYDNNISVSYFDQTGNEILDPIYHIIAKHSLQLSLKYNLMEMDTASDGVSYKSCHIKSTYPISVTFVSVGACAGGSYLALPVLGLGKNYVAACYNDNPGNGAAYNVDTYPPKVFDYAGGEFIIIGTEDATNVKIIPTATTVTGHPGANTGSPHPYTVQLGRGQCYLVRSNGRNEDNDMSGSQIEASKPVAVISGHENASLGGVDPFQMEARDFMIEQMVPVDFWDISGYISIPFVEPSPVGNQGGGDTYRLYTFDNTVSGQLDVQGISGGYGVVTQPLTSPQGIAEITAPAEAYSLNNKKISLMQYAERTQTANAPFPAPSMMTIVPVSRWKTSYSLTVVSDANIVNQIIHDRYLNIIGSNLNNINFSINGGNPVPLSVLSKVLNYGTVSTRYPNLKAAQYKLPSTANSCHFFSSDPFMVYYYGTRMFVADLHLGDYNYANFVDEYAAPAGMQLNTGIYPSFTINAGSTCTGWHVCIRDTGMNDPGLKAAILIDDLDGVYWNTPAKFSNVTFDATSSDYVDGELHPHWHSNQSYCFDVNFSNPLSAASAPLAIVDNLGNAAILRLDRAAPTVKLSTNPIVSSNPDSIVFPVEKIGQQNCTTFVLKNTAAKGGTAINLNSALLTNTDTTYKTSINISFPHSIAAGDSVLVQVCYTPIDSSRHQDSLILTSDCFSLTVSLDAHGSTGLISAGDLDFGTVTVGDTICKLVQIKNIGSAPFTLQSSSLFTDTVDFSINTKALPKQLAVGAAININICFHPQSAKTYSDTITWTTDLEPAFQHSVKDRSILTGTAMPKQAVKTLLQDNSFTIRPNPANGNSVIVTFSAGQENSSLNVFDVLGREVYKKEIQSGVSQIQIPIQNLSEGTYYVRLTSTSGTVSQSFVKVP